MSLHKESHFESEICDHLAGHGWIHAEGDVAHYDRDRALFPPDLLAGVQGDPAEGLGDPDEATGFGRRGNPLGSRPRPARPARQPRRIAQRRRSSRSAPGVPKGMDVAWASCPCLRRCGRVERKRRPSLTDAGRAQAGRADRPSKDFGAQLERMGRMPMPLGPAVLLTRRSRKSDYPLQRSPSPPNPLPRTTSRIALSSPSIAQLAFVRIHFIQSIRSHAFSACIRSHASLD
jgi:hypothetical protein